MKKVFSLLLALVMLALPVLSVAEEAVDTFTAKMPDALGVEALAAGRRLESTITITNLAGGLTDDPDMDVAMIELLKALSLMIGQQGDEYDVAVQISGEDVLNLDVAVKGEDAYIKTDMLGDGIVVNAAEVEVLVSLVLDKLVKMGVMQADEANQLKQQIAIFKQAFEAELASTAQREAINLEELDYSAFAKIKEIAQARMTAVTEIVVPRMCDPAVQGVKIVYTNEDVAEAALCVAQFLLDNPALKDIFASAMGLPTDAQLSQLWETNGQIYMAFGIYADEAAFRADQQTIDSVVLAAMEQIRESKLIAEDYVITLYADEAGAPVYATLRLVPIVGEAAEEGGEPQTAAIDAVYTRQTNAAGVAHVCNISFAGNVVTVDVLVKDHGFDLTIGGQEDGNTSKLLEMSVERSSVDVGDVIEQINVKVTLYDGMDQPVLKLQLEGEWLFHEARSYLAGKLNLTPAEDEGTNIILEVSSDTAIDGIDFSGEAKVGLEAAGIRLGIKEVYATTDAEESGMSGDFIHPATLDDAAFTKWFIDVVKNLNLWQAQAIDALPESLMKTILFSGDK